MTDFEVEARAKRQALAALEAEFTSWRELIKHDESARVEERLAELDAWILRLGKMRHEHEKAERAVIRARQKGDA